MLVTQQDVLVALSSPFVQLHILTERVHLAKLDECILQSLQIAPRQQVWGAKSLGESYAWLVLQELEILEKLRYDDNIVQLHGHYIQDKGVALVLEYMEVGQNAELQTLNPKP